MYADNTPYSQPGRRSQFLSYAALVFLCLIACATIAVPLYVIRPFRAQNAAALAVALSVRRWGPWLAPLCAAASIPFMLRTWRIARRWTARAPSAILCALTILFAVLVQINIYEIMFHPVEGLRFVTASRSKVLDDDIVLAISIGGQSRAYPIRTIGYHHIVNDWVGGVPVAATYCTLCHTGLVWRRDVNGRVLTFRLGGINNQNALLRDVETGSFWQQSTGVALSGPLAGTQLQLVPADELTFAAWRKESPRGTIMAPVARFESEYETRDWDQHIGRYPTVVDTSKTGIAPRELMLGVVVGRASRAYPLQRVLEQHLVSDSVGGVPVVLVVGPDGKSVRCFSRAMPRLAIVPVFYRKPNPAPQEAASAAGGSAALFVESATGSEWDFRGCAVSGPSAGVCLTPIPLTKCFWFNWHLDHPRTTVYAR
jgi:hypothetical protein